jgi:hypothetical protein
MNAPIGTKILELRGFESIDRKGVAIHAIA